MIENFSTKQNEISSKSKILKDNFNINKSSIKRKLKFLNDKQAQNISILIKSTKSDAQDIYQWIIDCNLEKLNQNYLEQLEKIFPENNFPLSRA